MLEHGNGNVDHNSIEENRSSGLARLLGSVGQPDRCIDLRARIWRGDWLQNGMASSVKLLRPDVGAGSRQWF